MCLLVLVAVVLLAAVASILQPVSLLARVPALWQYRVVQVLVLHLARSAWPLVMLVVVMRAACQSVLALVMARVAPSSLLLVTVLLLLQLVAV